MQDQLAARPEAPLTSAPAQRLGLLAHAQHARGDAPDDGVGGHVLRDHGARADDRVVADRRSPQDAGAVADPAVVAAVHVALVDALQADRAVLLDDPVVEVDQHHAIGDDALAPDRDVLEGRDRALLPEHRLRADRDLALVRADLRPVADPRPAPEMDLRPFADLERHARADEADAVGHEPSAPAQLQPDPAGEQPRIAE